MGPQHEELRRREKVWLLCARLYAHPGIFPESNSVLTLQKSFRWDLITMVPCVYTHVKISHMIHKYKDIVVHVRVWWIMPGNTKISEHALKESEYLALKLDTIWKKKHNMCKNVDSFGFGLLLVTAEEKTWRKNKHVLTGLCEFCTLSFRVHN